MIRLPSDRGLLSTEKPYDSVTSCNGTKMPKEHDAKENYLQKLLITLIICVVLPVACSPFPPPAPAQGIDLLSDNTCNKPCVLGITPGITTPDEAWAIVQKNKLLSGCRAENLIPAGSPGNIYCHSSSFSVLFNVGLVAWISLAPPNLTVGQLISMYKTPDAVGIARANWPNQPDETDVLLFYDKIRTQVSLGRKPGQTYTVGPDTQVSLIFFHSDDQYVHIRDQYHGAWHGYRVYAP
jgi:hypothetical protein